MKLYNYLNSSKSFNVLMRQALSEMSGNTSLQLKHQLKNYWDSWIVLVEDKNLYEKIDNIIYKNYSKNIKDISNIKPSDVKISEINNLPSTENIYNSISLLMDDYHNLTINALSWATLCNGNEESRMRLKTYLDNNIDNNIPQSILEIFILTHQDNLLNESIDLNKILQKIGFTFSKEKGLIQILAGAGKHMMLLFKGLFIAWYTGLEEDKLKVKQLIDETKITKEHVVDFLFKIDEATLHLLTGPLYLLSSITGWKIRPKNPQQNIEPTGSTEMKIKDALQKLNTVVSELPKKIAKNFKSYLKGLSRIACKDLNLCIEDKQ